MRSSQDFQVHQVEKVNLENARKQVSHPSNTTYIVLE